ncbi:MAG: hypothetical protein ACO1RX_14525 [Candidatus Sericytochromatia bacterium]
MSLRALSLEEWFLVHQLRAIDREHCHLPGQIEADLSRVNAAWQAQSEGPLPLAYLVIKATALTLKHEPGINRQLIHSWRGLQMRQHDRCTVNVPVLLRPNGQDYLSVLALQDADRKTLAELRAEVQAYRQTPLAQLPVGKYIVGKPNTFFNRTRLRLIHALVNRLPSLQERFGAGTCSVSAMFNLPHAGSDVVITGRGPGAFSVTACHYDAASQRLRLAIAWDHYTGAGMTGTQAAMTLCRILQGELELDELLRNTPLERSKGQAP